MTDNDCPICHCDTGSHSEHLIRENCELCGMGISTPTTSTPICEDQNGKAAYFCCERCRGIFIGEMINNRECINMLKKQKDSEAIEGYDEVVKDVSILYINHKYPKDREIDSGGEDNEF